MGKRGMRTGFWWETKKTRDHSEDLEVGRIILKCTLEK
jgi:hypothetical protein